MLTRYALLTISLTGLLFPAVVQANQPKTSPRIPQTPRQKVKPIQQFNAPPLCRMINASQKVADPKMNQAKISGILPNQEIWNLNAKQQVRATMVTISSEKEAQKYFAPKALAALKKQVDYTKEELFLFGWKCPYNTELRRYFFPNKKSIYFGFHYRSKGKIKAEQHFAVYTVKKGAPTQFKIIETRLPGGILPGGIRRGRFRAADTLKKPQPQQKPPAVKKPDVKKPAVKKPGVAKKKMPFLKLLNASQKLKIKKNEKAKIPAISPNKEIWKLNANLPGPAALSDVKLSSEKEAKKYFDPKQLAALKKQVDFTKQDVILLGWTTEYPAELSAYHTRSLAISYAMRNLTPLPKFSPVMFTVQLPILSPLIRFPQAKQHFAVYAIKKGNPYKAGVTVQSPSTAGLGQRRAPRKK